MKTIDACPICGANIQATRTEYLKNVVIDAEGDIWDDGVDAGCGGDTDVYCANDHTLEDMTNAAAVWAKLERENQ